MEKKKLIVVSDVDGVLTVEDEHKDSIAVASVNLMNSVSIDTSGNTSYKMDIRLFGFIKLKEVNVVVKEPESVYVGGIPIGIHLETKGILIVDTGNIKTEAGEKESPSKGILTSGDYILEINNIKITDKAQMADIIQNSDDDIVDMLINRNGEEVNVKISPVKDVENLRNSAIFPHPFHSSEKENSACKYPSVPGTSPAKSQNWSGLII